MCVFKLFIALHTLVPSSNPIVAYYTTYYIVKYKYKISTNKRWVTVVLCFVHNVGLQLLRAERETDSRVYVVVRTSMRPSRFIVIF